GVGGRARGSGFINGGNTALADYTRFGINTRTDGAKRQVYLPLAGQYDLAMVDQRTSLGLGAAGNATTCYYTTIKQVAMPTPTTLTVPTTSGTDTGNVQVFRFSSTADATVVATKLSSPSTLVTPASVLLRNNTFVGLGTDQGGN